MNVSETQSADQIDDPKPTKNRSLSRSIKTVIVVAIMGCLIGGTALSGTSVNFPDLAKVVAVLAFIVSMAALAFGMAGDASRS